MISQIKKQLSAIKSNLGGWTTHRKILVLESDDWGSIRMPSKEAFKSLIRANIPVNLCPFLTYDSLEQIEDFEQLFEILHQIKNQFGKTPQITANYIMANPNFEFIESHNFENYDFISLEQELENRGILSKYKQCLNDGIKYDFFKPQLHGREHVNIPLWLKFLNEGSEESLVAFQHGVYGISTTISKEKRTSFLASLNYANQEQFDRYIKKSLEEGYQLFENFFEFTSKSFIAPNYTWDEKTEEILSILGVEYFQSSRSQFISLGNQNKGLTSVKHRTGEFNKNSQVYLVRNAIFEPSTVDDKQRHLDDCLRQINMSFLTNKPAILSMHRLNFMGGFSTENREINLVLFKQLIEKILIKWPEVEFMSSDVLGKLIKHKYHD